MRLSTLPPLVVAIVLILGAAAQYPGGVGYALGGVGLVFAGVWLALEVEAEITYRRSRESRDLPPDDPGPAP